MNLIAAILATLGILTGMLATSIWMEAETILQQTVSATVAVAGAVLLAGAAIVLAINRIPQNTAAHALRLEHQARANHRAKEIAENKRLNEG